MAPTWRLVTTVGFDRDLVKLDRPVQVRIMRYLVHVTELNDPRQRGKGLTGDLSGQWRYRVGDYRVIAQIVDRQVTVLALSVGHRSGIY